MEIKIISDTLDELHYSAPTPEQLKIDRLQEADFVCANGEYGQIAFQHLATPSHHIWFSSYDMKRKASFKSFGAMAGLELHFNIRRGIDYLLDGIGALQTDTNHFNITYLPWLEAKTVFTPGVAETFDIHINPPLLEQASAYFPPLNNFLNQISKQQASQLSHMNHYATAEMLIIISQIKSCYLKPPLRSLYIDSKITELLLLVFNEMVNEGRSMEIKLSAYDIECLLEVKRVILQNLDHPYTLRQLARMVGLNEFKLKRGYKQFFGMPVYHFLRDARMSRSIELLTETDKSVTDIAFDLGFPAVSAFSNAFKNKFGYAPTMVRKNKIKK
jgi:AraC-like DNA-binding protein